MNAETMALGLQDSLSGIFECSETPNGSVRVRTLLTHPDGDLIDLFLIPRDDGAVVVTDYGDTIGWLRTQSAVGLTSGRNRKITRVCRSLNVARAQGRITVIAQDSRTLGEAVARVAQAAVLISHIAFK